MGMLLYAWMLGAAVAAPVPQPKLVRFQATEVHMGVPFKIVLYAPDETTANRALSAAFARIAQLDKTLSDYDPQSELSRLGRASPTRRGVKVSDDLWRVLATAQALSRRSDGAFDVTVGPLSKLWRRARRKKALPPEDRLAAARHAVGFEHLRLDPAHRTVRLLRAGMQLDLGGIAKGYAADEALAVLREKGITRALVDGSGDLAVGDSPPEDSGWKIGIAPPEADAPPSRFLMLANVGIATSGDTWQHVDIDGRRYSHILDPRSGVGLTRPMSVTVVAPDCMTADSLASAVSVLGVKAGLELVEGTCGVAALIVRPSATGVENFPSRRFSQLMPAK